MKGGAKPARYADAPDAVGSAACEVCGIPIGDVVAGERKWFVPALYFETPREHFGPVCKRCLDSMLERET